MLSVLVSGAGAETVGETAGVLRGRPGRRDCSVCSVDGFVIMFIIIT